MLATASVFNRPAMTGEAAALGRSVTIVFEDGKAHGGVEGKAGGPGLVDGIAKGGAPALWVTEDVGTSLCRCRPSRFRVTSVNCIDTHTHTHPWEINRLRWALSPLQ